MPNSAFFEKYNILLKFYRDINRLIELVDRYEDILEDFPDPNAKEVYFLASDIELIQDKYNAFYFIRRRCLKKAQKILDTYSDLFEDKRYSQGLLLFLTDMVTALSEINGVARMSELFSLKDQLISQTKGWSEIFIINKDIIADNLQELVNKSSGEPKKDPKTDDQRLSTLRTAALTRLKDQAIQTIVLPEKTTGLVIEERLRSITEKIGAFKYLDQALQNFTDSSFFNTIKDKVERGPAWLRVLVLGDTSVGGLSSGDVVKGKFTLQNLFLRRKIRKSGVLENDLDKIDAYWRDKIRRKYGKDALFCDETRDQEGNIVKENDELAKNTIIDGQVNLLSKIAEQIPDDH